MWFGDEDDDEIEEDEEGGWQGSRRSAEAAIATLQYSNDKQWIVSYEIKVLNYWLLRRKY